MRNVDLSAAISPHFTYKDALWLPQWNRAANESDGITDRTLDVLEGFFNQRVEAIREALGLPMHVDVCCRPKAYNELIGGAKDSAHMVPDDEENVAAIDYKVIGMTPDDVRAKLEPMLPTLQLRMERKPGSSWIHNDSRMPKPGHPWYFIP